MQEIHPHPNPLKNDKYREMFIEKLWYLNIKNGFKIMDIQRNMTQTYCKQQCAC